MMRMLFFVIGALFFVWGCGIEDSSQADFDAQFAADIQQIDAWLAENGIDATVDPSGLRYLIHEQGAGAIALPDTSEITVNFEGRLMMDNSIFDQADTVIFPMRNLIVGWRLGIPLIQEGGSMTMYIPSGFGFGPIGTIGIPPNANLIFDVDLIKVE